MTYVTRRSMVIASAFAVFGCVRRVSAGNVDLVQAYSPTLQQRLPRELPFTALYRRHGRTLAFAAVVHSRDPTSKTFSVISDAFDQVQPRSIILEGFPTAWGSNPKRILDKVR